VNGNATCCPAGAPCKEHRRELQVAREVLVISQLLDRADLREMCLQALDAHPGHDLLAVPAAGTGERRSTR
jgi:hypothetical protein